MPYKKADQPQPHQKEIDYIAQLRAEARVARDANNVLMQQIWDINHQLLDANLKSDVKDNLLQQKRAVERELQEKQYSETFDKLLVDIEKLEIELYGQSDLSSHSPFQL